jgi:oxygen-independent coproporphyrinogen-3 oxidase
MTKSQIPNSNIVESLYIHIPFCKKKCNYCDFVSYADKENLIDAYINCLTNEIHYSDLGSRFSDLKSIYFGGGTPTLLNIKHFERILNLLKTTFIFNSNTEITTEANPGTADKTKLKELRRLGINRLSIGAQSFNDQNLKTLGRIHDSKDIIQFYENARAAGFDNISLDLIFALPGQTLSDWRSDLNQALHLKPNHLSVYNLQLEEGTPFYLNPNIKNQIPNEDEELGMYEYAINILTKAGFIHYEISNFAKPGFSCQHNINYWKNGNYFGIGAGAHSHINGHRFANPDSVEEYIGCGCVNRNVLRQTPNDSIGATDRQETLFMGLRLLKGLPAEKFQGFKTELKELIESGLLIKDNSHIKLTRKGLYLANEVFERFV